MCNVARYCTYNNVHGVAKVDSCKKYNFDIEDLDKHVSRSVRERLVNLIEPFKKINGVQTKIDD